MRPPAALLLGLSSLLGSSGSAAATAAWKRQPCAANVADNAADIVTKWGATVDAATQPLPEYPRPQLVRSSTTWKNLNGLWEWAPASGANGTTSELPPFGKTLERSILVPFPAESCLSGIRESHPMQWYRLTFSGAAVAGATSLLHFGAVDWRSKVYLNKKLLGEHTGGYDGFHFEADILPGDNELIVFVPSPRNDATKLQFTLFLGSVVDRLNARSRSSTHQSWALSHLASSARHLSSLLALTAKSTHRPQGSGRRSGSNRSRRQRTSPHWTLRQT